MSMIRSVLVWLACLAIPGTYAFAEETTHIEVPAGDLLSALESLAKQAAIDLVYQEEQLRGLRTQGLRGDFSPQQAVRKLLEGTQLELRRDDATGAMLIAAPKPSRSDDQQDAAKDAGTRSTISRAVGESAVNAGDPDQDSARIQLAQAADGAGRDASRVTPRSGNDRLGVTEEVIVTGTHIRGTRNSASQILTFDREDMDRTGYATVQQFIQALPQNSSSGAVDTNVDALASGGANNNNADSTRGTGINLRGLGNDSTLVLLNGHRLPPSGAGDYVDVSMIPLSAVKRIDVLADGASAIYGSDAIGGVVNITLRDDYEGAESRLRGGAARGGSEELQIGQTLAAGWRSGRGLLSYEYYSREKLHSSERWYTRTGAPRSLLPEQKRQSVFASLSQTFTDDFEMFADIFAGRREMDTDSFSQSFVMPLRTLGSNEQIGGTLGGAIELTDSWRLDVSGTTGRTRTRADVFRAGVSISDTDNEFEVSTADLKADGRLWTLPGGELKLAIGAQYRDESYDVRDAREETGAAIVIERDSQAVFAELFVPLVGNGNAKPGLRRLELSAAGRHEEYSDSGSTSNPKLGLLWTPISGFDVRSTYGKSFRAPSLFELNERGTLATTLRIPDPQSPTGTTPTIIGLGNNSNLGPERSTMWTAGIDLRPDSVPGLSAGVTWFDIEFEDRIANGLAGLNIFQGLVFENILGPEVIIRNPSPELIAEFSSFPTFFNPTNIPLADVRAIVDNRLKNLASTTVRGLDVIASWALSTKEGDLELSVNGSYLFEFTNKASRVAPGNDIADTAYNPVDLRLRTGVSFSRGGFIVTGMVNYVDSYTNSRVEPAEPVSSWTTVDLILSYDTGDRGGGSPWSGMRLSLNAINAFDKDPPYVTNPFAGINVFFDSTNANALGRFISLQLTKEWGG